MPDFKAYATLAGLRTRNQVAGTDTGDDGRYLQKLRAATQIIDRYCAREFQPVSEARTFDWTSPARLDFRSFELLTLTSLIDGSGNTKQTTALIMQGGKFSDATKWGPWFGTELDMTKDFLMYQVTPIRALTVNGVWGWHADWPNAWLAAYTNTTLATPLQISGAITANAPTISLNSDPTLSLDAAYQSPAISAGSLIQIDTEWMQVLYTASGSTTITLLRGVNGTTAASHSSGAPITVYQPPRDINEACLRIAQWILALDDAPFQVTVTTTPAMGQTTIPAKIPTDICTILDPYVKARVA
jgi:hypothetical protein